MICIQLGEGIVDDNGRDIYGEGIAFVPRDTISLSLASEIGSAHYVADPWTYGHTRVKEWVEHRENMCLSIMTMNILGHGLQQIIKTTLAAGGTVRLLCPPVNFFGSVNKQRRALKCLNAIKQLGAEVRFLYCSNSQHAKPKAGSRDKPHYAIHVKYFHMTSDSGDMVFATTCNADEVADTYFETAIVWKCDFKMEHEQWFFQQHWNLAFVDGTITPPTEQLLPFRNSETAYGVLCSPVCSSNLIQYINRVRNLCGDSPVAYAGKWAPNGAASSPGDDWLVKFLGAGGVFYYGKKQARSTTNNKFETALHGPRRLVNNLFKINTLHAKGIAGNSGFAQYSVNLVGIGHDYIDVPVGESKTRIGEIARADFIPSPKIASNMRTLLKLMFENQNQ